MVLGWLVSILLLPTTLKKFMIMLEVCLMTITTSLICQVWGPRVDFTEVTVPGKKASEDGDIIDSTL